MARTAKDAAGQTLHDHWAITQAELAELLAHNRTVSSFVPHDGYVWGGDVDSGGIRSVPPSNPSITYTTIPNGWDHEHCTICFACTSDGGSWRSNGRDEWICEVCYKGLLLWSDERKENCS